MYFLSYYITQMQLTFHITIVYLKKINKLFLKTGLNIWIKIKIRANYLFNYQVNHLSLFTKKGR